MKKIITEKANQLSSMYVTENPINFTDSEIGYKYFVCFHNTHKIVKRCKTQNELEMELDDIIANGASDNGCTFY